MSLRANIIYDVIQFHEENYDEHLTAYDVEELPLETVLNSYLSWNGILGFTSDILNIIESCLHDHQNLETK